MQFLHSIDNLLSPEECEKYMNYFSDPESVERINDTHRKYNRVQFTDKELAEILYEKIKNSFPDAKLLNVKKNKNKSKDE